MTITMHYIDECNLILSKVIGEINDRELMEHVTCNIFYHLVTRIFSFIQSTSLQELPR
jgi:hypothetical protein